MEKELGQMKLENYTPHTIDLYKESKVAYSIPSSGNIRLEEISRKSEEKWNGIDIYSAPEFNNVFGIPEALLKEEGEEMGILVSMPVGNFLSQGNLPPRIHIFGPDTGPANGVRNEKGQIIGTKALIRYK